jgi:hypothetical protein
VALLGALAWRTERQVAGYVLDATEQGDEADEGRLEARRSMVVGGHRGRTAIVNEGGSAPRARYRQC